MTEEDILNTFFYNDNGKWVFKYADPRVVIGDDSYIDILPRVVKELLDSR